jgi:hypothetical protein
MTAPFDEVADVLQLYFDGLYHSDTQRLRRVFHPQALYATASSEDGALLALNMPDYFAVVDKRPAPASRGDARHDRILSIEFIGPVTALAKVECAVLPRRFTDLLSLVRVDGRWQIMAKVFHAEQSAALP